MADGPDPIELQITLGALHAACREMGAVLIRSAHSSNIKERRDASTALFDADGQMVMQAEHIPVHLGAMPAAVAAVAAEQQREGISWILNNPYAGGTHLPDITVVSPVYAQGSLIGFSACRAHHADVGARRPGSMPADSRTLAEEGVVIDPQVLDDAAIARLTARMRQSEERRADLRAQLAANNVGARRLHELAERIGVRRLRESTDAVLDYGERRTRECLRELGTLELAASDVLEAREGDLRLDLRAMTQDGHLTLGNERFTYYETLGGGQGACADADGPSGVHVAMSNTLNTPIEALEREFPLHVARYELRRGSGGEGRHRGGDGVVREVRALEEMSFSLIAERRRHAPAGADGGAPGACGRDLLDGHPLPGKATGTLARGQSLRIETPGGGGFGDGGH